MLKFQDKTALITGGGSGIGEALAYEYARRGCHVILTGRRMETLEGVAEKCRQMGVKALCHTVDIEVVYGFFDLRNGFLFGNMGFIQ